MSLNKKPDIVYFDMDGVICALFEFVQLYLPELIEDHRPENGFKLYKFIDDHTKSMNLFEILPKKKDFSLALGLISDLQKQDIKVEILSSVGTSRTKELIAQQKRYWLGLHGLGHLEQNFVEGSKLKGNFAGPGKILIDDYDKAGKAFTEKGGTWIKHTDFHSTILRLNWILEEKYVEHSS